MIALGSASITNNLPGLVVAQAMAGQMQYTGHLTLVRTMANLGATRLMILPLAVPQHHTSAFALASWSQRQAQRRAPRRAQRPAQRQAQRAQRQAQRVAGGEVSEAPSLTAPDSVLVV